MKSSIWKNRIILILIVFAAAVFTELFVFNFRTIQSLFYKEIQIPVDGLKTTGILSFGDGVYKFDQKVGRLQDHILLQYRKRYQTA